MNKNNSENNFEINLNGNTLIIYNKKTNENDYIPFLIKIGPIYDYENDPFFNILNIMALKFSKNNLNIYNDKNKKDFYYISFDIFFKFFNIISIDDFSRFTINNYYDYKIGIYIYGHQLKYILDNNLFDKKQIKLIEEYLNKMSDINYNNEIFIPFNKIIPKYDFLKIQKELV